MQWDQRESVVNRRIIMVAVAAVVGVGLGFFLWWSRGRAPEPVEAPPPVTAAAEPEAGQIQYPVPAPAELAEAGPPLPDLAESDEPLRESLSETVGEDPVKDLLIGENIVRNIVATVDNLSREKLAQRLRPIRGTPGSFEVNRGDSGATIDPVNYRRYKPFVALVEATDTGAIAQLYFRFYPLFQQAYEDLGYPDDWFNDRVVAVIDHLLETPEVQGPIRLVQPKVFFEFADPALESRSAGQKTLIRMGTENAKVIKDKLRTIRAELTAFKPGEQGAAAAPAAGAGDQPPATPESLDPFAPD